MADFERLLLHAATHLAKARWHEVGGEVNAALKDMLDFCCVDQAGIVEVLPGNEEAYLRYLARGTETSAVPQQFSYGEWFPWTFRKVVLEGEVLSITAPEALPAQAATDRASMHALNLRAMLHIPLKVEQEVRFALAIGCKCRMPAWPDVWITRLKALGEIVAHAISRAEAAGALRMIEHEVRDSLSVVHLGHWEWDIGADKMRLSDEAKHVLGADVPAFAQLIKLVQLSHRGEFMQSIETARAQPGSRFTTRYAITTPAGERRMIRQCHEVMFPGDRTARLLATVQDVTARLDMEREVTRLRTQHWHAVRVAQTALLVASLAHELCQPLAAILNNAQAGLRFLQSGNLTPEDLRAILTDIVASDRRAGEVLSALRAMLRRQQTTRVTFDAADAVHDVLALVRSELISEHIEVETSVAPRCYLNADKTQIEQVLLNLVMNSIDAMRGKREVGRCLELTLSQGEKGYVQVSVKDSGKGIPASKLGKVFEAFWTTKEKGLGIGLPVCRAIVESYGGRIWCETNDAGGVTFRVKLPSAQA